VQDGLGTAGRAARREELAQLLDRLSQRLPVWRLTPHASHWPERAMQRIGAFEEVEDVPGWAAKPRPVRLLRRPPFIGAMALLPDAPPSLLRIGRASHRVLRAEGPERFEPEWWRDRPDRRLRDYYRVELTSGVRLWVCRIGLVEPGEEARWALHGHLP
jgi:protein ImuB